MIWTEISRAEGIASRAATQESRAYHGSREEYYGNEQAKNPGKAEAATNREVFIESGETAGCGAEPEACEEVASPLLIACLWTASLSYARRLPATVLRPATSVLRHHRGTSQ